MRREVGERSLGEDRASHQSENKPAKSVLEASRKLLVIVAALAWALGSSRPFLLVSGISNGTIIRFS